jgi:hypothetical protein
MEERSHIVFVAARWGMAVALAAFSLLAFILAPSSGLLTLPFAVLCAGLTLWLVEGAPHEPSLAATWICGVGGGALVLEIAAILLAG